MRVEEATGVDDALVDAFARLTPQLSRSNPAPTREELDEIGSDLAGNLDRDRGHLYSGSGTGWGGGGPS